MYKLVWLANEPISNKLVKQAKQEQLGLFIIFSIQFQNIILSETEQMKEYNWTSRLTALLLLPMAEIFPYNTIIR